MSGSGILPIRHAIRRVTQSCFPCNDVTSIFMFLKPLFGRLWPVALILFPLASALSLAQTAPNWAELRPTTFPPARCAAGMAYDPTQGKVVLFGGQTIVFGGNNIEYGCGTAPTSPFNPRRRVRPRNTAYLWAMILLTAKSS